ALEQSARWYHPVSDANTTTRVPGPPRPRPRVQHQFQPQASQGDRRMASSRTFDDLIAIMDRLRDPGGCPWDREQTYATLAPMLLEEAYEAFDALEEARLGRPDDLREELGDLLFQITFFARVAKEKGEFTIDDVITQVH